MKKLTFVIVAYFCFVFSVNAQIKINEDTISMSQGLKNSFSVEILEISPKEAEKKWVKYLKPYKGKTKKAKKSNEWLTDNAKMKLISNNTVDMYAVFTPIQNGTLLIVWYNLGGVYLNSQLHGQKANAGKQVLYDFALSIKKEQAKAKILEEENKLKELETSLEKLSKDEKEFQKTIDELKAKIAQLEADVKSNQSNQVQTQADLATQKKVIEEAKRALDTIK